MNILHNFFYILFKYDFFENLIQKRIHDGKTINILMVNTSQIR
jgi:hypothetical protein